MEEEQLEQIANSLSRLADAAEFVGPLESDLVTLATLIVAIAGVVAALIQLRTLSEQIKIETERRRKEAALNVLQEFAKNWPPEFDDLSLIVQSLGNRGVDDVYARREVVVNPNVRELIEKSVGARAGKEAAILKQQNDELTLNANQAGHLRSIMSDYVNHMENALAPVEYGIADETIVYNQLTPYFSGEIAERLKPLYAYHGSAHLPYSFKHYSDDGTQAAFTSVTERRLSNLADLKTQKSKLMPKGLKEHET